MILIRLCRYALFLLLAGCQSAAPFQWSPSREQWESFRPIGVKLTQPNGNITILPPAVVDNLLTVVSKLEKVSNINVEILVIDEFSKPNAYAMKYEGKNYVGFTTGILDKLAKDPDALAAVVGHELAHLLLEHGTARSQRDAATIALSTAASAVVPFSGLLVAAANQSFTRDEERAADDQGLRWAMAAGFDPCGHARLVAVLRKEMGETVPLLSSHPGFTERSDLATEHARKAGKTGC